MVTNFRPEYSAQRRLHPTNPLLPKAISESIYLRKLKTLGKTADIGCGKLRHLNIIKPLSSHLVLVDTEYQIEREITEGDKTYSVKQFIERLRKRNNNVTLLNNIEFSKSRLNLDTAISVAVADVVPSKIHLDILNAIHTNLKGNGHLILIVPRNDKSITDRCTSKNKFEDGHYFNHHGVTTFFRNFKSIEGLLNECKTAGFDLILDKSNYKQVCLILGKDK